MKKKGHLIVICGPTGIGKTHVSIQIAQALGGEIISSDSRQFFKEMSIGTAVPSPEELKQIPHHFIHSHTVLDRFNASSFEQAVLRFLETYFEKKKMAIMVGGSGMYIDAVCKGIDDLPTIKPEVREKWLRLFETKGLEFLQKKVESIDPVYYKKVDRMNHKRLLKAVEVFDQTGLTYSGFLKNTVKNRPFYIHKIGLNTDRKLLYDRINKRVDAMMRAGLLEEAKSVLTYRNLTPLKTVGYKELFQYFDGALKLEEAVEQIKDHSRAYARRQLTWFRRDKEMKWFEPLEISEIVKWINNELQLND